MTKETVQVNVRMKAEQREALHEIAKKSGVDFNTYMQELAEKTIQDSRKRARERREARDRGEEVGERPQVRCSQVEFHIESPVGSGKLWPSTKFVLDPTIQEGESYFVPTGHYKWSGRLDAKEIDILTLHLCGVHGHTLGDDLRVTETGKAIAHRIAEAWIGALDTIQDSQAVGLCLYPVDSEIATLPHMCAAWLHWVRDHPKTDAGEWQRICCEIGITEEQHESVRNALTRCYTQLRGYLIADYPFFTML